ncbi:hypothetical protein LBMAG43_11130 [Methylococcaceae bacterium]|nr:hypothetical protein LBMAG43_11130 [Methylococcaceae bacterium]
MPNEKIPPSFRQKRRLGLIALAPMMATMAMSPYLVQAAAKPITATAKYDTKIGKVVVAGKTAATISAGAKVTAYDAANNIILYTSNSNAKNAFSMQLLGATSVPCMVRLEVTNPQDNSQSQVLLPVSGTDASCKTVPACAITKPAMDTEITVGSSLAFEGTKVKGDSIWSINDGSADVKQATTNHQFTSVGKFLVELTVTDGSNQCSDNMTISVIPPIGTNPNGKVPEQVAPKIGEGMPTKSGGNDTDALVVFPYEEMGMQGGSQIHLPYNSMINYNSLNAQVIKKVEHKPILLDSNNVSLAYSAASNANDPAGKNSINSTSQNLFDQNKVGTNYDTQASTLDPATGKPTKNVFIAGQDYRQAKIRKSEQWDRIHQPVAVEQGIAETGIAFTDQQNRYAPAFMPALPDQGVRGNSDKALGMREMPGSAAPYVKNDPKAFSYSHEKQNFTAQFLPASDIDDQGRTNPYPLMRVEAKVGGQTVAKTDAVYTTASETRCRECHTPGKIAGDEDVWRMPVTTAELVAPDGKPGAATGAGSFDPGTDATKPWPPAIHNKFDDKIDDNPTFTNLDKAVNDPKSKSYIERDQNGLRKDRVKESRWVKVDANGKPTTTTSATKPADADKDPSWKLQVRLNFREAQEEGGTSWVEQEKAALFNTLIMHDYMVYFGPTPATGKLWPASYSTQIADSYADDKGKSRAQPMYFCSGHHQSSLKFDVGVVARVAQTNRSDYSKAFHAFHGKMQVYKADASASASADGLAHKKGDLIRDERGHPKMLGGRGWDSQHNDGNSVPLTADANGDLTKPTVQTYDTKKNNWRTDLFPADKNGELMVKVGENVAIEENCAKCHTGATEKSYRDIHHTAGLKCDSCHGDMLAVGNVYPNDKYNANLTGGGAYVKDSINFRRPWLDNPNCGSCHVGDGNKAKDGKGENFSAGVLRQAWATGDKTGYSRDPANARFAVMPTKEDRLEPATATDADVAAGLAAKKGNTFYKGVPVSQALYRKSADVHGSGANGALNCSTCHGGSHAIWPNQEPNANDNQTAKQLQGYDGNIAECSVCHVKDDFKTGLVATDGGTSVLGVGQGVRDGTVVNSSSAKAYLAGPHGMHPVGDESWYFNAVGAAKNTDKGASAKFNGGWHNDFAKKVGPDGEDQCAACHGADHKGTRLSKSLVDRTLTNAKGKAIKVAKGQVIGCDLCHTMAKSFVGSPTGVATDHPAPKPETFVISNKPAPTTPATGGTGTTGGMGGMTMSH